MEQELGIEKIMVRILRRFNKLVEIAMLAYAIAFKISMIGGHLVKSDLPPLFGLLVVLGFV